MQGRKTNQVDELYRSYRPLLFGIAYRMLGSAADAEDLVHDVFVQMQSIDPDTITNLKAYLSKLITNRCLNELKSARKQREVYVGPWLPEPLLITDQSPLAALERDESLLYGFMVMLEQLKPAERAVFILREVLDFEYVEIADILGITDTYCRQLLSRARKKVRLHGNRQHEGKNSSHGHRQPHNHRPNSPYYEHGKPMDSFSIINEQVHRFFSAFKKGNIQELTELLAEDVIIRTDGGGNVRAAINPIYGRQRVLIFLSALHARGWSDATGHVRNVNGEPGIIFEDEHGVKAVACFDWEEHSTQIRNIYVVLNPQKLTTVVL